MRFSEFQTLIKELYYTKDHARGVYGSFIWLIEEIGELAMLLRKEDLDLDKISEEIADIIAWTSSIANLLNIDIENALKQKYPNKCSKCNSNPCECKSG
ncbi:MAG: MazG nucleotide pyrophosphohydrolase domain-containing protein [Candidatus Lokiarchaeota archaeon]|jgi:NTP pyrophosphatase (non-canonical NTP hydrolase)